MTYTNDYILYDSTDIKFLEKAIDTESQLVIVWVLGQEWRLTKNHAWENFLGWQKCSKTIVVIIVQLYKFTKNHLTIHL